MEDPSPPAAAAGGDVQDRPIGWERRCVVLCWTGIAYRVTVWLSGAMGFTGPCHPPKLSVSRAPVDPPDGSRSPG